MVKRHTVRTGAERHLPRVEGACILSAKGWTVRPRTPGHVPSNQVKVVLGPGKRTTWTVQKLAWVNAGKDIPDGHVVIRLCTEPACVNVDHITTGDAQWVAEGRTFKHGWDTHCKQGHVLADVGVGHNGMCMECNRVAERERYQPKPHVLPPIGRSGSRYISSSSPCSGNGLPTSPAGSFLWLSRE